MTLQQQFFEACEQGNLEQVKQLLNKLSNDPSFDINAENENNETILRLACRESQLEIVDFLLCQPNIDVNKLDSFCGSALTIACENDDLAIINRLLQETNIDVNVRVPMFGYTPLALACRNGYIEVVKKLLADPRVEVNRTSIDENAELDVGDTPFMIACKHHHLKIIRFLLNDPRVDVNYVNSNDESAISSCFEASAQVDYRFFPKESDRQEHKRILSTVIRILLKSMRINVNASVPFSSNDTLLLWACRQKQLYNQTMMISYLVEREDIDLEKADAFGYNALALACQNGNEAVVDILLPCINENVLNQKNKNPLILAIQNGNINIIKNLLREEEININIIDNYWNTPWSVAFMTGNIDVILLLYKRNELDPNVYFSKPHGDQQLLLTKLYESSEMDERYEVFLSILLSHPKLDINKPNPDGLNPLQYACKTGREHIVKRLLHRKDINLNDLNQPPIIIAYKNGYHKILDYLLSDNRVNITATTRGGESLLSLACTKGDMQMLERCLSNEVFDINKPNSDNETPFFIACSNGHLEVIHRLLADQRLDVTKGISPLFGAITGNHVDIVTLLLKIDGIDINSSNNLDKTPCPLFAAFAIRNLEIINLLLDEPFIDINQVNKDGESCFFACCSYFNENPELATRFILEKLAREPSYIELNTFDLIKALINNGTIDYDTTESQTFLNQLAPVVKDLQSNITAINARKKALDVKKAALTFALTVGLSDGYFSFKKSTDSRDKGKERFFKIAKELPMDQQMTLCCRLWGLSKNTISVKNTEDALKKILPKHKHSFG